MADVLDIISKAWERLATFILGLSFRPICFFLAILFCLFPGHLSFQTKLDRALLAAISSVSGARVGPALIGIVSVPDSVAAQWDTDIYDADVLASLLSNILHSSSASVGLLLDRPLENHITQLDTRLDLVSQGDDIARQMLEKKRYLNQLIDDPRVVLGTLSLAKVSPSFEISLADPSALDLNVLKNWYSDCIVCELESSGAGSDQWYPAANDLDLSDYLWLPTKDGAAASFLSALILNKQAMSVASGEAAATKIPNIFAPKLKIEGEPSIPIQAFISAHKTSASLLPKIISLSMDEALLVNAFPEYVLITSEGNRAYAEDKAAALYGLLTERLYISPWWFEPAVRIIVLVFLLYLCLLHFRIKTAQKRAAVLSLLFLCLFISVVILAAQLSLWLPLSSLMLYISGSVLVFSLYRFHQSKLSLKRRELRAAIEDVIPLLEDIKYYREAMGLLAHYPNTKLGVEKICRLADKMEENKAPLNQVISFVGSLIPIVGEHELLNKKLISLKKTLAVESDLSATQARTLTRNDSEPVPSALGRYQIHKEIGRGAVGIVYLGFDPAISRSVAIKTLDARKFSKDQHESLQARFFREAEAAGRLNHPNIVSVFDVGEDGHLAYIAMDYVEGMPLSDFIQKQYLMPVSDVFRAMHDVASALSYAHENQIVHRDIKPGNIMFASEPYTLKVADFGIARLLDNSKTSTGEILGSPLYMAPEQLKGSKVGPTADIFSLGVTFYQLLTGELPFNADNLASLTYEIIHTKHRNIRSIRKDLPASATRIVNQCLQKKPYDRYESALELSGVLRKAIRRDFPAEAKRWGML